MILNSVKILNKVTDFLRAYTKQHGKALLVFEMAEYNPASQALAQVCLKTNVPCLAVVPEGYTPEHSKLNIVGYRVPDIQYSSFDLKVDPNIVPDEEFSIKPWEENVKYAVMSQVASGCNGVIVSSVTRELLFCRAYHKGCLGDLLPFADLFMSEVLQLYPAVGEHSGTDEFTIEELEWACRENDVTSIIESSSDPAKHRSWGRFTLRQRQVAARLNQIEKLTRHKITHAPICELRNTPGLVR